MNGVHTNYILSLECQVTLSPVRTCPCIKCTLWRISIATEEQAAAESMKPKSWMERLFGKRERV
jgi:hypothetical protein